MIFYVNVKANKIFNYLHNQSDAPISYILIFQKACIFLLSILEIKNVWETGLLFIFKLHFKFNVIKCLQALSGEKKIRKEV